MDTGDSIPRVSETKRVKSGSNMDNRTALIVVTEKRELVRGEPYHLETHRNNRDLRLWLNKEDFPIRSSKVPVEKE